jgi:hypothetical protein
VVNGGRGGAGGVNAPHVVQGFLAELFITPDAPARRSRLEARRLALGPKASRGLKKLLFPQPRLVTTQFQVWDDGGTRQRRVWGSAAARPLRPSSAAATLDHWLDHVSGTCSTSSSSSSSPSPPRPSCALRRLIRALCAVRAD